KLVPLRYVLRQGDIVEIITSPSQHPSRDWLKIAKSTRARSKINQWLKVEERARSIELGREMFDRETKKYRLNGAALLGGEEIKRVAGDLGYPGVDDLLAAVGYGKASVHRLLNKLSPGGLIEPTERPRATSTRPKAEQGVRIRGVEDLLVRFAKCCNPLPGDQIVGFITRGRGLTVHARDCLTVAKSVLDRERIIDVEWDIEEPGKRPVRVGVYIGRDRPGILSEITGAISGNRLDSRCARIIAPDRLSRWARVIAPDCLSRCARIIAPDRLSRCARVIAFMTRRQFEALVEKAMRKLPKDFKDKIKNVAIV